jgi:hypothetical protein
MRVKYFAAGFLVASTLAVGGWATAQSVPTERVTPRIMSGADVGFRVEGLRGGTPVGTIVVQVNGEWVAAEIGTPGLTTPLSRR